MLIGLLIFLPVITASVLYLFQSVKANNCATVLYAAGFLVASLRLYAVHGEFTQYFVCDSLNIFFLLIFAVVQLAVAFYGVHYLGNTNITPRWHTFYTVFLLLFSVSITGAVLSSHLGLFWVFIEATTLMSAPFIYFERTRHSLEAVWKYVFICSIGIALAFAGVVVLLFGSTNLHSLYFSDLYAYAGQIDPFWLKISFLFMLVGFGTKAGLAPMHAWLPDAHSEAPAPISALLSGVILNTAFLGILRMQKVLDLAGAGQKAHLLLIAMGLISVFVSAVYMVRVSNYKRMLAYSSIENMGIAAIGIGVGGPAVFAAVLQIAAHSFTKAAFFMTSGNIYQKYGTKNAGMVRNLLQNDRLTGWLWIACFLSMAGFPPFPGFVAKFLLIKAMFAQGYAIVALILLALLVIILYGTGSTVIGMVFAGETAGSIREVKMGLSAYLPQAALIALLVFLGMYMPAVALKLFADAAGNL